MVCCEAEQRAWRDAERVGEHDDRRRSQVRLATFDELERARLDAGALGQLGLREPKPNA
jgi:hypothetical protein